MTRWHAEDQLPELHGKFVDPYFRWACVSDFRGFKRFSGGTHTSSGSGYVGVAELPALPAVQTSSASAEAAEPPVEYESEDCTGPLRIIACIETPEGLLGWPGIKSATPPIYHHLFVSSKPDKADVKLPIFFTASVSLAWLTRPHPGITWELSTPFRDADGAAQASSMGMFGPEREKTDFQKSVVPLLHGNQVFDKVKSGSITGGTIAVIDFGCPFLNSRFLHDVVAPDQQGKNRKSRRSRVVALWDQGSGSSAYIDTQWGAAVKSPWSAPVKMGYGRELSQSAATAVLQELLATRGGEPIDEAEAYRRIDYLIAYDDPRRRVWAATHGAHVLDMAGGAPDPLDAVVQLADGASDAASKANLVFVQLPALTAADSSGASLSAQLLDGLRYVLDVCAPEAPVVINISYGSYAGPHDGKSLIERAMDDLIVNGPKNLAIVLGVGNGRQSASHVRRAVSANRSALLRLDIVSGDTTDTFVEIWYDQPIDIAVALQARARTPSEDWSDWVAAGVGLKLLAVDSDIPIALLRHDHVSTAGQGKAVILLALAPTRQSSADNGPSAPPGHWEVEIRMVSTPVGKGWAAAPVDHAVLVDAWIERDDPGDLADGVQSSFIDLLHADQDESTSSLCTGNYTIAVGGFRLEDGTQAPYSSIGTAPIRSEEARLLPDVHAACEIDEVHQGIRGAAVRSSDSFVMNGTSVAAPVFARRVYNWMMKNPERYPQRKFYEMWPEVKTHICASENRRRSAIALPSE